MKKLILFTLLFISSFALKSFGQESKTISGLVKDAFGEPVPVASIKLINSDNKGAFTNFNGEFQLKVPSKKGQIEISSLGFTTKLVSFETLSKNSTITLESSSVGLNEVLIVASTALDRKTPVAFSTIKKEDIELKLGSQEFVEILKSTPGVYTSKGGGGFGDGEIQMRGFNSQNVGVLINGVPVNDMESGQVYWSNWAGLGNVTSSTQTQRGLGASKVAVPSIGGTMNIITQTTDAEQGGAFNYGLGNNGYNKLAFKYSTGLMKNGLAVTVAADRIYGQGYVDGTQFNSASYFTNISYKITKNNTLSFTLIGAQQTHGQRYTKTSISDVKNNSRGVHYNPDWGYKQGQITSIRNNFYNKPQISLNDYWTINDKNKLTTTGYVSFGTGGGGRPGGTNSSKLTDSSYRIGNYGPIDLDRIEQENITNGDNGSDAVLVSSRNDHFWAGVLSTLSTKVNDNLTWVNGVDLRTYKGTHFQEVTDLLGGQYYLDNNNINNPNNAAHVGDKVGYYNNNFVNWSGVLSQIEYNKDRISIFATGNLSNTSYVREDLFQKTPGNQKTKAVSFLGYGLKGGANYRLDNYNNIFVNVGYFEKAPFVNTVWPTYSNDAVNKDAKNQKITSFEIGYGLRTDKFTANINAYYTEWGNKSQVINFQQPDKTTAFANITGLNALHKGVEFDFEYRPINRLKLTGMLSLGDWKWTNNILNVPIIDQNQKVVQTVNIYSKNLPVGNSAQTTAALGLNYSIDKNTTLAIDYNYYDRYYANFDPAKRDKAGLAKPWEIPSYNLFDAVFSHKFKIKNFDTSITARMNNVFNTKYISVANDTNGTAQGALVYYGFGRTFSISTKINF